MTPAFTKAAFAVLSEQVRRVQAMAEDKDGDTWDLSPNDRAALLAVLDAYDDLIAAVQDAARGANAVAEAHRRLREQGVLP